MKGELLKSQFTEEFFEEFQYDSEFRNLFEHMLRGVSPYEVIEHLCKSKKELSKILETLLANQPMKLIFTEEGIEHLKDTLNN